MSRKQKIIVFIAALLLISSGFFWYEHHKLQQEMSNQPNEAGYLTPGGVPDLKNKEYNKKSLPKETSLIFTGDIIPARMVNYKMSKKNDFTYPFDATKKFLKNADYTIINMESPLTKDCKPTQNGMVFCGNQKFVKGLNSSGVDVVSLANNHILNKGTQGLDETKKLLNENGISYVGENKILYKTTSRNVKIAFISYNDILPRDKRVSILDKDKVKKQIATAKEHADFVVVMFHWGKEYSYQPVSDPPVAKHAPKKIARLAVDNGADLVVGNHPHTVQGYEKYKGKYIFYALGNFIFDQMWSEQTGIGYVLRVKIHDTKISSYQIEPIKIGSDYQPVFLKGKEKKEVLQKIKEISDRL